MRIPLLSLYSCNLAQPVHATHHFLHRMISCTSVTLSRWLLLFLMVALTLQGYARCDRKQNTAHSMDWGGWPLCCPATGSGAREDATAGISIWVWLWGFTPPYIHPQPMGSWFCRTLSRHLVLSFVVVLGGGCGIQHEAQQYPLMNIPQAVCLFWLWRTGVNLQRSQFTVLFKTCCSTSLAVQHSCGSF